MAGYYLYLKNDDKNNIVFANPDSFSAQQFPELPVEVKELIMAWARKNSEDSFLWPLWEVKIQSPQESNNMNLYGNSLVRMYEQACMVQNAGEKVILENEGGTYKLQDLDVYYSHLFKPVMHTIMVYAEDAIKAGLFALEQLRVPGKVFSVNLAPKGR